jgi:lipoyl(octanoyl) transferase
VAKIAAVGIRVSKWISYHGIAINISPDLSYFKKIIPCGIQDLGVTSTAELGKNISLEEFDKILIQKFHEVFL